MEKLVVRGTEISVQWNSSRDDFISLTDIAKLKDSDNPRYIIQNWLRNRNTIEFLGVWESLYNPEFNRVEFETVKFAPEFFIYIKKIITNTGGPLNEKDNFDSITLFKSIRIIIYNLCCRVELDSLKR